jgi:hypothetical protein
MANGATNGSTTMPFLGPFGRSFWLDQTRAAAGLMDRPFTQITQPSFTAWMRALLVVRSSSVR